jgi:ABC-type sulfate transport system permease component
LPRAVGFEAFGLSAALPVAALLILVALVVFALVNVLGRRRGPA